jgi:hypothetical protein
MLHIYTIAYGHCEIGFAYPACYEGMKNKNEALNE